MRGRKLETSLHLVEIEVTEINKDEYIQLLVEARVNRGVTAQAAAFLTGRENLDDFHPKVAKIIVIYIGSSGI